MKGTLASLSPTRSQFPSVLSDHAGGLSASALSWGGDVDTGKEKKSSCSWQETARKKLAPGVSDGPRWVDSFRDLIEI